MTTSTAAELLRGYAPPGCPTLRGAYSYALEATAGDPRRRARVEEAARRLDLTDHDTKTTGGAA